VNPNQNGGTNILYQKKAKPNAFMIKTVTQNNRAYNLNFVFCSIFPTISFKYCLGTGNIITFQEEASIELRTNLTMGFDLFVSMRVYCPYCKRTVEVLATPEYFGRRGEVRYVCPQCGRRI